MAHVEPDRKSAAAAPKGLSYIDERAPPATVLSYFPPFRLCTRPSSRRRICPARAAPRIWSSNDPKYGDWVYQGDAMLGRIMEALEQHQLAANTLLIATADNGAEGRAYAPRERSKTQHLRRRPPRALCGPLARQSQAGSTWNHTVCLNDLLATAAEIIGPPSRRMRRRTASGSCRPCSAPATRPLAKPPSTNPWPATWQSARGRGR